VIGYKKICQFTQVSSSRVRLNITRSWDHPEISNFALYRTLSGIDLTPEDTSHTVAVMPSATTAASLSLQPKITVNGQRITINMQGQRISHVEIVRMDGRSVKLAGVSGSKAVSSPLTSGVYVVKTQTGGRTFQSKIAVSR
ncbi:MAG: T9SS type A sorting domain-containing protein, partial [Chitinispirillaceae bacterium]|nr:T9SS type A sorting domain-containing protein [Chitinispirillaceae bacterium]